MVIEMKDFKIPDPFTCFIVILGVAPSVYHSRFLLKKIDFCQVWLKLAERFLRRSQKYDWRRTVGDQNKFIKPSVQVS